MSTETRNFHLAHVLSITTKILCPLSANEDYPFRTVRQICDFMTNEPSGYDTFIYPRIGDECRTYLLEAFPQLASITVDDLTKGNIYANMNALIEKYGDSFEVRPIHPEDHQIIDPQVELAMIAPDLEIISFTISNDEESEE